MTRKANVKPAPTCAHHWDITPIGDGKCRGVCRKCGEQRDNLAMCIDGCRHKSRWQNPIQRRQK